MADDERWIVVDGRRWRATDPSIPDTFRHELVDELMAARRAVKAGKHDGDDGAVAAARGRVQDAKVALGERGRAWWEEPTKASTRARLEAATRALARHRAPDKTICPSDAARAVGGEDWRAVMPVANEVAKALATAGELELSQKGQVLDPKGSWKGPIRIRWSE